MIMPFTLVLLIIFYILMFKPWAADFNQSVGIFWSTVGCYVLLALFYFLRRPYLAVTKDKLETRKFAGYKTLKGMEIRKIVQMPGYIVIETVKGGNWVFSKLMNRYPIDEMAVRLKEFASQHQIEWETRTK